jgi:multiple sugar transport system permease protein
MQQNSVHGTVERVTGSKPGVGQPTGQPKTGRRGRAWLRSSPSQRRGSAFAMAGPGLLLCLAMSVIVVTNAVWLIVHHENLLSPQHQFVGASELRQLLNDHTLRGSLVVTVVYVATALPIEVALGVGISLLLHYGVRGGRVVRSLIIVPMVLAPLIVGLIWRMIYDPSAGLLDYFLREVSLPSGTAWLANPHTALWGIILADVWQWTPFIIIITVAALESLPVDPFEAAQIDGAGTFQTVRHLTLPLLQPALAIAVFLRLIGLVNSFASIWAMTMGGPGTTTMTFNVYAYQQGFVLFFIGYATTMCFLYGLLVTFGIMPLARRVLGFAGDDNLAKAAA